MTDKEKAAREYAEKNTPDWGCPESGDDDRLTTPNIEAHRDYMAFIAGHDSRQPEIDELKSVIAKMKIDYLEKSTDWMKLYENIGKIK